MKEGTKTRTRPRTGNIFKRGDVYWLRYQIDGERIAESLDTKNEREAKAKAAEIMAPIKLADKAATLKTIKARVEDADTEAAIAKDIADPPLTLAQVWSNYLKTDAVPTGKRTRDEYEGHWQTFWDWLRANHAGVVYLRDITPEIAESFIKSLVGRGLSGQRTNKYLAFLKSLCHELRKAARMGANPFAEIKRRKQTGVSKRPLTTREIRLLIKTSSGELRTLFYLGAMTGLRLGDCATLKWSECDLARGIIVRVPRKTAYKGKSAQVTIGIPAPLLNHLSELPQDGTYVCPKCADQYLRNPSVVAHWIQTHMEECGIETRLEGTGGDTGKRGVAIAGFHSLRHYYISAQAQAGTPQAVLQKLAGHGNPQMTAIYTHVDENTARMTAANMPSLLPAKAQKQKGREPLPAWAIAELRKVTGKNWQKIVGGMLDEAKT